MKFTIRFSGDIELSYDLVDNEVVPQWKELILSHTASDCCPNNHYIGYSSFEVINERISRLYTLCDLINSRVPDRTIKHDISVDEWRHALSVMHVHFPDLKNDSQYQDIWDYLTEYNDIIHWLESTLPKYNESSLFRITLDFNKTNTTFIDIPESAYELFSPHVCFGELSLHYTHVGKNAFELFTTRDFECPADQFVPQRTFSASVRMYFTEQFMIPIERWETFYEERGGKQFWQHAIDDPKLGFGFIKIGQLSEIRVDGKSYSIPCNTTERNEFRKLLVNSKVIDWKVD